MTSCIIQKQTDVIMNQPTDGDDEKMGKPADEDVLAISKGPMTRSRSKKLTEAIGGLVKMSWKQEECLGGCWGQNRS
ncbi:hypothetical protein DY000_02059797 [Brassica cretica]|uniref:Uncharacterized protein n=1 Tax=Brassica cretica TaxID=69181 RepID=A0ABQ7B0W7_BRACR|nr:hypothetical protein DY000_02059797 [Brassica cretica]